MHFRAYSNEKIEYYVSEMNTNYALSPTFCSCSIVLKTCLNRHNWSLERIIFWFPLNAFGQGRLHTVRNPMSKLSMKLHAISCLHVGIVRTVYPPLTFSNGHPVMTSTSPVLFTCFWASIVFWTLRAFSGDDDDWRWTDTLRKTNGGDARESFLHISRWGRQKIRVKITRENVFNKNTRERRTRENGTRDGRPRRVRNEYACTQRNGKARTDEESEAHTWPELRGSALRPPAGRAGDNSCFDRRARPNGSFIRTRGGELTARVPNFGDTFLKLYINQMSKTVITTDYPSVIQKIFTFFFSNAFI